MERNGTKRILTPPIPFNCFKNCAEFNHTQWNGMIIPVCGECALRITSLIDCPKENPYPAPVKTGVVGGVRSGRSAWVRQEIARKKALDEVRIGGMHVVKKEESYQQRITRLLKEDKKKRKKK